MIETCVNPCNTIYIYISRRFSSSLVLKLEHIFYYDLKENLKKIKYTGNDKLKIWVIILSCIILLL